MKNIIGTILAITGIIMVIGGMSYGMWQIHPIFGIITGGMFLGIIGVTMIGQ